jgi:hypothetical protein
MPSGPFKTNDTQNCTQTHARTRTSTRAGTDQHNRPHTLREGTAHTPHEGKNEPTTDQPSVDGARTHAHTHAHTHTRAHTRTHARTHVGNHQTRTEQEKRLRYMCTPCTDALRRKQQTSNRQQVTGAQGQRQLGLPKSSLSPHTHTHTLVVYQSIAACGVAPMPWFARGSTPHHCLPRHGRCTRRPLATPF